MTNHKIGSSENLNAQYKLYWVFRISKDSIKNKKEISQFNKSKKIKHHIFKLVSNLKIQKKKSANVLSNVKKHR
jgi:hypothetical protein